MIEIEHPQLSGFITVRASGTLSVRDYEGAIPEIENELEIGRGPLRLLILLEDFHGWEIGAFWEDLKFDIRHRNDPGRIAIVGESRMEEWATRLSAPFAEAEIRYFPYEQKEAAKAWLVEPNVDAARATHARGRAARSS
jgi:hypothetical protein